MLFGLHLCVSTWTVRYHSRLRLMNYLFTRLYGGEYHFCFHLKLSLNCLRPRSVSMAMAGYYTIHYWSKDRFMLRFVVSHVSSRTGEQLTRLSALVRSSSKLDTAYRVTDCTSKGSNFAESSSFATARAMFTPSDMPGGVLVPPENACPTASVSLLDERDR